MTKSHTDTLNDSFTVSLTDDSVNTLPTDSLIYSLPLPYLLPHWPIHLLAHPLTY